MKILMAITSFAAGGAEILCRNLAKAFVARGHDCHVAAVCEAASVGNSPAFERSMMEELRTHHVGVGILGNGSRSNPIQGAARLRAAVRAFRPDVLHIHAAGVLLFQALGMIRLPTVYTHHNSRMNFPASLFFLFDRFVDNYVAISRPCAALLERYVGKPIVAIPNGVPGDFFAAKIERRLPTDPEILSVGSVTPQKDYRTLVEAAKLCVVRLAEQGRRIRFHIAGGGDLRALQAMVDAAGMGDSLELLGTRSDIGDLMRQATIIANSSLYEGLPISLIEAAMAGLPAVATDVGGTGEIVLDGISGFLVPPERPALLAEAVVDLVSDAYRYREFSYNARNHSQRFTLAACADKHLKLYETLSACPW